MDEGALVPRSSLPRAVCYDLEERKNGYPDGARLGLACTKTTPATEMTSGTVIKTKGSVESSRQ
jgi:hypothetical protein